MSWLRRGRRARIELALRGGFENFGNQSDREEGGLTPVMVFPYNLCLTLLGREVISVVRRWSGRVLGLCCWGWLLDVRRCWPDGGFGVFWRRLDIMDVLGEGRFVLDDHGGVLVASGLH